MHIQILMITFSFPIFFKYVVSLPSHLGMFKIGFSLENEAKMAYFRTHERVIGLVYEERILMMVVIIG